MGAVGGDLGAGCGRGSGAVVIDVHSVGFIDILDWVEEVGSMSHCNIAISVIDCGMGASGGCVLSLVNAIRSIGCVTIGIRKFAGNIDVIVAGFVVIVVIGVKKVHICISKSLILIVFGARGVRSVGAVGAGVSVSS